MKAKETPLQKAQRTATQAEQAYKDHGGPFLYGKWQAATRALNTQLYKEFKNKPQAKNKPQQLTINL